MAFTDDEKYSIIFALCHDGKTILEGSTSYSGIIAARLDNLNTQIETRALSLIASIEAMRLKLESGSLKDNVKQIGDIILDTDKSMMLKQKELNRLLDELSKLLDIPNRCRSGGSGGMGCLVL